MVSIATIGSGTGSFIHLDPTSNDIEVGPDSAGHKVGVSNVEADLDHPTVTDCNVLLGYLNPDNFLGGDVNIDVDRARRAISEDIAEPLGSDPTETARGVLDIVEREMANEVKAIVLGLGYSPENYHLLSYGGGGPLHVAGYTNALDFKDVLIPEWAAAFSAYGCACSDYAYRYDRSLDLAVDPDFAGAAHVAGHLTEVLLDLKENVLDAFARDDTHPSSVSYRPSVRMQYQGMLDDLEVNVPPEAWDNGLDADGVRDIAAAYDEKFEQVFQRAARSPEQGYEVTMGIGAGVAPSPKPELPSSTRRDRETPPESATKGQRAIYWDGSWVDADIWEMQGLESGNVAIGPAVLEAPATTLLVPPGHRASLDENRIYHLTKET
jgi:N-methylhydantoinase A/oxoprolinase/acetone carboxylase beta subunit